MARKRHSPESIAKVLRQAESGVPIAEVARKVGVHENTVHLTTRLPKHSTRASVRDCSTGRGLIP